jgi:hypothetical protein
LSVVGMNQVEVVTRPRSVIVLAYRDDDPLGTVATVPE